MTSNTTPDHAPQRTPDFAVQLRGAGRGPTRAVAGPQALRLQSSGINRWQRLIFRVAIFITPFLANAGIPFGPTDPISLKGEVAVWTWRGGIHYSEESWATGIEYDVPAHYLVVVDVPEADKEVLKGLTALVSGMSFLHWLMFEESKPTQVILLIPTKRVKEMRIGAMLEITKYSLRGSHGQTLASFEKFTIDGKKPTLAGPLFPVKSSRKSVPKSKSSDARKVEKKDN